MAAKINITARKNRQHFSECFYREIMRNAGVQKIYNMGGNARGSGVAQN